MMNCTFVTAALALRHPGGAATTEVVGDWVCDRTGIFAPALPLLRDPFGRGEA